MALFRRKSSPLTEAIQAKEEGLTTEGQNYKLGDWLVTSVTGITIIVPDSVFHLIYAEVPTHPLWDDLPESALLMSEYGHKLILHPEVRCLLCGILADQWMRIDATTDIRIPCKEEN